MIIEELMVEELACVAPDDMFSSAVSVMSEKALSCVLITQNGKPEGIVTERDVVSFFTKNLLNEMEKSPSFHDVAIGDVITKRPVCVHKSTSLYDALSLAQRRNLRHLLVIDEDDVLVGLVTQSDMTEAYLRLLERQKELETENEALYQLSHQDSLMNIGNRRAMTVALDAAEAIAKRYKKTYSVALIDVDFFKKYNDHYGHPPCNNQPNVLVRPSLH